LVDTTWEDKMVFMEGRKQRPRRTFTAEFRERAVALVLNEKRPIRQVARDLDVSDSLLHVWLKKVRTDRGQGPPDALTSDERAELAQLRKENRILREEREILRKAAAFFAKEDR
jgi:transposase